MAKRNPFHSSYVTGAILQLSLFLCTLLTGTAALGSSAIAAESFKEAVVVAIHDGDTVSLKIDGKVYRSRLIGIDAPEMGQEPWGKMSKKNLKNMLKESNKRVLAETDVVKIDKYDRPLVYLWMPDRSSMLNERMLREGYAYLFTIQPNSKYVERFVEAQRAAKQSGSGIWGPDGPKERPRDYKKRHPR